MLEDIYYKKMDRSIERLLFPQGLKQDPRAINIKTEVPDYENVNPGGHSKPVVDISSMFAGRIIIRRESAAEHSWNAMVLADELCPDYVNVSEVNQLLKYHDYPEIMAGDVPLFNVEERERHKEKERKAYGFCVLISSDKIGENVRKYWPEFEYGTSIEARYARAIDRLDGLMTRISNGHKLDETHGSVEKYWQTWSKDLREVPELLEFGWHLFNYAERHGLFG